MMFRWRSVAFRALRRLVVCTPCRLHAQDDDCNTPAPLAPPLLASGTTPT